MDRLKDKIVLVTGAIGGIGLACVKLALEEGAEKVFLSDYTDNRWETIKNVFDRRCEFIKLDVRSENNWEIVLQHIHLTIGRLNVLINNAGISGTKLYSPALGLEETTLESWREVHSVNLDGIFLGCKTAMQLLALSKKASIINIGSRSSINGRFDRMAYASSKAALSTLTKSIAIYAASKNYGIRCNLVLPSTILTPLWEPVFEINESHQKEISEKIPLKRFGTTEEVAHAAIFLASDEASYITGAEIIVDGGMSASDSLRS
jgi:NAD(P)-dependent dehydrogenase (short-subunit alcohol dehydrogenase family)